MTCTSHSLASVLGLYYLLVYQHATLSRTTHTTRCHGYHQSAQWVPFVTLLQQVQPGWVCEMQMLESFLPHMKSGTKAASPTRSALHC